MELTEIKGSLFGYSKKSVRRYVSELNDLQSAELEAKTAKAEAMAAEYEKKIKELDEIKSQLEVKAKELSDKLSFVEEELSNAKASNAELEESNKNLTERCETLETEAREIEARSEVISTAIINAEKYATTTINDADERAKEMIVEAEGKVNTEAQRLETAKTYISEVRVAVEEALRKIDAELGNMENDISAKKEDLYSENKKKPAREKFEMFFKKA